MAQSKFNIIHHKQSKAFTLLEVLVALTVIAITLGAIIKTSADQALSTSYLKEKFIGNLVATNALNQLLLDQKWPSIGKTTDSSEMAKHEWHWRQEVVKTLSPDTRKIIYRVYNDENLEYQVSHLVGYVTNPRFLTAAKTK